MSNEPLLTARAALLEPGRLELDELLDQACPLLRVELQFRKRAGASDERGPELLETLVEVPSVTEEECGQSFGRARRTRKTLRLTERFSTCLRPGSCVSIRRLELRARESRPTWLSGVR
jgi:hypothetical protein